jgi:hypothetical protein
MNGMADGQLAFERQVAAFLGSMAEEIPAGRYDAPRSMIARAHARVAATLVGAVLLLAAIGVGGAMIVHALSSAIGNAASAAVGPRGSANAGSDWRLGAAAGSNSEALWGSSRSRRYLGASAPGHYSDGLPGDIGPGRPGFPPRYARERAAEGSSSYGRPQGDGLGGFGESHGGKSGDGPVFGGGPSGGFEPPGGWIPGSALGTGLASIQIGGPMGPSTAASPAHHGRKHATDRGRARWKERHPDRRHGSERG